MQTVYVVGAGAGVDLGFPTGEQLKKNIANFLRCQVDQWGDCKKMDKTLKRIILTDQDSNKHTTDMALCNRIADSMPLSMSIDNFIDSNRDDERIASLSKIAIIKCIAESEKNSTIYGFSKQLKNYANLDNIWLSKLFQTLSQNCTLGELKNRFSQISFIIFNYDRCVEEFLIRCVETVYGVKRGEAESTVNSIEFIHPYGSLGSLFKAKNNVIEFGKELDATEIEELSSNIRTFTEGLRYVTQRERLQSVLNKAERIIFLGFAFHPINMELFKCVAEKKEPEKLIYSTTFGMSDSDKEMVTRQLESLFSVDASKIQTKDVTCSKLFSEYQLSLGYIQRPQLGPTCDSN
ncbi:hypothetical protein ACOI22_03675 [Glaciecola sp. 2405UD65-10]|uniref:hypothetical protein n=1 Tax=Glaciecola sp. 2405UD65-10 TaxID=3397244 RepID=UPI003B5B76C4